MLNIKTSLKCFQIKNKFLYQFQRFNLGYKMGVSAVIVKDNRKILLLKRENEPFKNLWCFPGGKIEQNETYSDATKREILEETGLSIKIPDMHLLKITYLKEYMIITSISKLEDLEHNSIPEDKIVHIDKSQIDCKWFSEKEALDLDENEIVPGIKLLIPKALELYDLNI